MLCVLKRPREKEEKRNIPSWLSPYTNATHTHTHISWDSKRLITHAFTRVGDVFTLSSQTSQFDTNLILNDCGGGHVGRPTGNSTGWMGCAGREGERKQEKKREKSIRSKCNSPRVQLAYQETLARYMDTYSSLQLVAGSARLAEPKPSENTPELRGLMHVRGRDHREFFFTPFKYICI